MLDQPEPRLATEAPPRSHQLDGVRVRYGQAVAVDGVSLSMEPGQITALLGPSGCGNTMLLRTVASFIRADAGQVLVDGRAIDHLPPGKRELGIMFQSQALFPHTSAAENVAYGLATLMFFSWLRLLPSFWLLVVGHAMIAKPFASRTVGVNAAGLDPALLEAPVALGASPWRTFRRLVLPLIVPGVATGAFLAFVSSLDNVPVSLFLSLAENNKLPIRMWGMMESSLDVRVAAALLLLVVMDRTVGLVRRTAG